VLDAMTGQDAVNVAETFNQRLNLDGIIMTKLDGDARGGAALSSRRSRQADQVLAWASRSTARGVRPRAWRRASSDGRHRRLVKDFEQVVDAEKAEEDALRMLKGKFDMQDFLEQIRLIQKMGSLKDLFEKLPFSTAGCPTASTSTIAS